MNNIQRKVLYFNILCFILIGIGFWRGWDAFKVLPWIYVPQFYSLLLVSIAMMHNTDIFFGFNLLEWKCKIDKFWYDGDNTVIYFGPLVIQAIK